MNLKGPGSGSSEDDRETRHPAPATRACSAGSWSRWPASPGRRSPACCASTGPRAPSPTAAAPGAPSPRRYTKADIGLLAEVDALHGPARCSATPLRAPRGRLPTDISTTCRHSTSYQRRRGTMPVPTRGGAHRHRRAAPAPARRTTRLPAGRHRPLGRPRRHQGPLPPQPRRRGHPVPVRQHIERPASPLADRRRIQGTRAHCGERLSAFYHDVCERRAQALDLAVQRADLALLRSRQHAVGQFRHLGGLDALALG